MKLRFPARNTFAGALLLNFIAFLIPALYGTLQKLWIGQIDPSGVRVKDAWGWMTLLTDTATEGLSRVAYLLVGDLTRPMGDRLQLATTLVLGQGFSGIFGASALAIAAPGFALPFFSSAIKASSTKFVRVASFAAGFGVIQAAVEATTRSLDRPEVPVVISLCKTILNIILDAALLSPYRVDKAIPTYNTQAAIRLSCDGFGAFVGCVYFVYLVYKIKPRGTKFPIPTFHTVLVILHPGNFSVVEAALRHGLLHWLAAAIVPLSAPYAAAFGVFKKIRLGLIMVPALALDRTSVTMMGHRWGAFRERFGDPKSWRAGPLQNNEAKETGIELEDDTIDVEHVCSIDKKAPVVISTAVLTSANPSYKDIIDLARPGIIALVAILVIELILNTILSAGPIRNLAFYLSSNAPVADLAANMFHSLNWTYILLSASMPLASILLATRVDLWFFSSLVTNLVWLLPWCIFFAAKDASANKAWTYHSVSFAGPMVLGLFVTIAAVGIWTWHLRSKRPFLVSL
ncbi:hypothetical protein DFS34DRAFT_680246 [Phlyctochytrium arcticum]|nr:hypothetical protein DFS34DRAFT_680246 [Phlyctochytrium arcticum]